MLLGSHDSSAYVFDFDVSFWPRGGQWENLRKTARWLPCLRNRITAMSQNQTLNLYQQLDAGVKFLNIYISYCASRAEFYCSHTFATIPLSKALEQIVSYLDVPDEVCRGAEIHVWFRPDWNNLDSMQGQEANLLGIISGTFGAVPSRIKLYYSPISIGLEAYPSIENFPLTKSLWFDAQNVAEFEARFNEEKFQEGQVLMAVLTADRSFIELATTSIEKDARDLRPVALRLLSDKKPPLDAVFFDRVDAKLAQEFREITMEDAI